MANSNPTPQEIVQILSRPEGGKIEITATATGEKFIFSTEAAANGHFLSTLRDGRYAYMGMLNEANGFRATKGSKVAEDAREAVIFRVMWRIVREGRLPGNATVREVQRRRAMADREGKRLSTVNAREDARATDGRFGGK